MNEMMMEGICPRCGRLLQIPGELEEFSCLYCGERLKQQELVQKQQEEESARQAFEQVLPMLLSCVRDYRGYQRRINRNEFKEAFQSYEQGTSEIFERLNYGAAGDREKIGLAAERLLDDLEQDWNTLGKREQNACMESDKLLIAIFLVPAMRRRKLNVSEPFCEILQKKWCERHPKSPFFVGDYDSIAEGFQRKVLGLCFITTAVCEAEGKPDDCPELTAFRAFRDGWLKQQPDGQLLIDEYYNIAPGIVTCINLASEREKRYAQLRSVYLEPCYADLQAGRLERCKERYVAMVRDLEREYLS